MSRKIPDFILDAQKAAATKLRYYGGLMAMLDFVAAEARSIEYSNADRSEVNRAWNVLRGVLSSSHTSAAKELLMFGSIAPIGPAKDEGLRLLAERFAKGAVEYQVMDLLNNRDTGVASYWDADEKEFKRQVRAAIKARRKS